MILIDPSLFCFSSLSLSWGKHTVILESGRGGMGVESGGWLQILMLIERKDHIWFVSGVTIRLDQCFPGGFGGIKPVRFHLDYPCSLYPPGDESGNFSDWGASISVLRECNANSLAHLCSAELLPTQNKLRFAAYLIICDEMFADLTKFDRNYCTDLDGIKRKIMQCLVWLASFQQHQYCCSSQQICWSV